VAAAVGQTLIAAKNMTQQQTASSRLTSIEASSQVTVARVAELQLHLEFADSALKSSVSRSRERGKTKIVAFNYRRR
jgi:hypothetical protein